MASRYYFPKNELRKMFDYDPVCGELFWKERPANCRANNIFNAKFAGKMAGSIRRSKYYTCKIVGGVSYGRGQVPVSRVVWILHHGSIPHGLQVDHKNGNPMDNRLENLRLASSAQNMQNRNPRREIAPGVLGISGPIPSGKWRVRIRVNGREIPLGCFTDLDEAVSVRIAAEKKYYGDFSPWLSRHGNGYKT